ncbi:MAG: hypothetical protein ACFB0E_18325 [Leptolyngbyaceae cyanobacterium]
MPGKGLDIGEPGMRVSIIKTRCGLNPCVFVGEFVELVHKQAEEQLAAMVRSNSQHLDALAILLYEPGVCVQSGVGKTARGIRVVGLRQASRNRRQGAIALL